ncbi:hypothetical protein HDU76_006890 [Blyttiomyces sp. JEL0837]|nr:hypothetical protein HDU76_006890 [Blyttiomyces sp. JEL0837]
MSSSASTAGEPHLPKLKMKPLGRTGCMTFGEGAWNIPTESEESAVFEMLDTFRARGGNFVDTADAFGAMGPLPNDKGSSRRHLVKALEASLERLGTSYIDLYQLHGWDRGTPLKETLTTLNDFVRSGKVLYIGCSNFSAWQLQKSMDMSSYMGLESFVSLQQQYSLLERNYELDFEEVCANEGVGCLPWSPLKGGWLAGKFRRDMAPPPGSRLEWAEKIGWKETNVSSHSNDRTWDTLALIHKYSAEKHQPVSAISLRWLMQKSTVIAPIIGARTLTQLNENLKAMEFELSEQEMKELDAVCAVEKPYPYSIIENQSLRYGRDKYF